MAISPKCDVVLTPECEGELRQFGAILFGPPFAAEALAEMVTVKRHVCVPCYNIIVGGHVRV